eukprot:scaffold723_cov363-Prasinococcus_capsulatus_cf.AAC.16
MSRFSVYRLGFLEWEGRRLCRPGTCKGRGVTPGLVHRPPLVPGALRASGGHRPAHTHIYISPLPHTRRPRARRARCVRACSSLGNTLGLTPRGPSGTAGAECRHRRANTYPVSQRNVQRRTYTYKAAVRGGCVRRAWNSLGVAPRAVPRIGYDQRGVQA